MYLSGNEGFNDETRTSQHLSYENEHVINDLHISHAAGALSPEVATSSGFYQEDYENVAMIGRESSESSSNRSSTESGGITDELKAKLQRRRDVISTGSSYLNPEVDVPRAESSATHASVDGETYENVPPVVRRMRAQSRNRNADVTTSMARGSEQRISRSSLFAEEGIDDVIIPSHTAQAQMPTVFSGMATQRRIFNPRSHIQINPAFEDDAQFV